jgi:hypothetical protein
MTIKITDLVVGIVEPRVGGVLSDRKALRNEIYKQSSVFSVFL